MKWLVSACLLGHRCRYDGGDSLNSFILENYGPSATPFCPEELGGLPTPRPAAEIRGAEGATLPEGHFSVISEKGQDFTSAFINGARMVLDLYRQGKYEGVILKEGSPSCGVHSISRGGKRVPGMGVTSALLYRHGIPLHSSEDKGFGSPYNKR